MEEQSLKILQQQLTLKQRELDLVLAIDYIRDSMPDPSEMMSALVSKLNELLLSDLCLIALNDRESRELCLKAVNDRSSQFGQISAEFFRELEKKLGQTSELLLLEKDDIPASFRGDTKSVPVHLVVIPIFLNGERLGILLFARLKHAFTKKELELIEIAESQVDSAVIQAYEYYALQQRNKELETIYRVDNIRDRHLSFDEMLNTVLGELRRVIQAEAGFIMLYNQAEDLLELRAGAKDNLFPVAPHYDELNRISKESLKKSEMVCDNELGSELRSVLCLPLILEHKIIGVLGVINRYGRQGGFDSEDRRLLNAIASQMDTAIFESLERRHLREILGRSVDPNIMERLLSSSGDDIVNCERSTLSVLYADIRGSTALAEATEPELLLGFINDYLGRMTDVILSHEGTLDKFVGDEVMALFGAPIPQADHALRAIHVALDMQKKHQAVMDTWEERGVRRCPIGVGIATGELIVGEVGCKKRTDYTVIGRAANLGARLCGAAKGGQVIISQETYDLVKSAIDVRPVQGVKLKGIPEGVMIYEVLNKSLPL